MTLTMSSSPATPRLSGAVAVGLVSAGPLLWRVVERGRVIGHLQAVRTGEDLRYRARRYHAPSRAFRDLGEFWAADDAVDCVRFAR
ncbi:hypothetical protein [uncultured Microbacterium sp.]|uniref:hypothetical protein n=1 Tax=uncultured Microbacterium sp. TaxID=191216 RepID=UPI0028D5C69C|nr:hypothetical protein [uncultured Microbacterium sp.]